MENVMNEESALAYASDDEAAKCEENTTSHLGGHLNKTHIDLGTLQYIHEKYNIKSMLDIGCGPGDMATLAKTLNIDWYGIDGDDKVSRSIDASGRMWIVDFTKSKFVGGDDKDLAWAIEFLEHVEEKYMENYMTAFKLCKYAVVTAAPPGYSGHHHVNCKLEDYWIGAFAANGFRYDHKESMKIRKISTMKKPFMHETGMFFKNYGEIS